MSLLSMHTVTVTLVTRTRGTDGRTVDTAGAGVSVACSVQPLSMRERALLPEGKRETAAVKIYTLGTLNEGDRLSWQGATYEVMAAGDYSEIGVNVRHRKYFASKVLES